MFQVKENQVQAKMQVLKVFAPIHLQKNKKINILMQEK